MSKPILSYPTTLIPINLNPTPEDARRARLADDTAYLREQLQVSRRASREKEDELNRVKRELTRMLDNFMAKEEEYLAELRVVCALIGDLRDQLAHRPGPVRPLRYKRVQRGPE